MATGLANSRRFLWRWLNAPLSVCFFSNAPAMVDGFSGSFSASTDPTHKGDSISVSSFCSPSLAYTQHTYPMDIIHCPACLAVQHHSIGRYADILCTHLGLATQKVPALQTGHLFIVALIERTCDYVRLWRPCCYRYWRRMQVYRCAPGAGAHWPN